MKRAMALAILLVLLASGAAAGIIYKADLDENGSINVADLVKARLHLAGHRLVFQPDVNADGLLNSTDAAELAKFLAGTNTLLPGANLRAPAQKVNLLWIHHSTGGFWARQQGTPGWLDGLGTDGGGDYHWRHGGEDPGSNGELGLFYRNFILHHTEYGSTIGEDTDYCHWYDKFLTLLDRTGSQLDMLNCYSQNTTYNGKVTDPFTGENLTGQSNAVIMFKSCYPNSNIQAPESSPAIGDHAAVADFLTGGGWGGTGGPVNYLQAAYIGLLELFAQHPGQLFVVWVAPPETDSSEDLYARQFSDWMTGQWLQNYYWDGAKYTEYPGRNVLVFSYWNILTGEKPVDGRVCERRHNHHRLNPFLGFDEYTKASSPGFVDTQQAWWEGDSHPPDFAGAFGTKELINRLTAAWNRLQGNLTVSKPSYPATGRLAYYPLHGSGSLPPPGAAAGVLDGVPCTILAGAGAWNLGSLNHPGGSLAISFWYRPGTSTIPAGQESKALVQAGNLATIRHFSLDERDSSFIETTLGAGGIPSGGEDAVNNVVDAGSWSHVTLTYDAATGQVRHYLDAVQIVETQTPPGIGSLPGGEKTVVIGPGGGNNFAIRDLAIYSRALTPAEVQDIFLSVWPGMDPQPPVPPAIASFAPASVSIPAGTSTQLTAVFSGGTGSVDQGVGAVASGVAKSTGILNTTTTFTLTVTSESGASAAAQTTVTVTPPGAVMTFTSEGSSFAPVITVTGSPEILWTFADSTTSNAANPVKNYGTAGTRANTLRVTPWSALQRINLGYDAGDGGTWEIEQVPDQHVSAVSGLELVAPTLRQWCSSYNQIPSLDFSNFTELDTIECFLSGSLVNVNLTNTPKLKRACFEDCSLSALDLSQSPALEDLRGAQNNYPTINFGNTGARVWHICIRDNPQFTSRNMFADMTQFPLISELFIWNDNQTGTLRIPASHPASWVSILADGNHYTSLNLEGALQNPAASAVVNLRNSDLTSVNITGCVQITELHLENNQLPAGQLDTLLATLDGLGRNKPPTDLTTVLEVNIEGNETPSAAGYASAQNLAAKGWRVIAEGWTLEPPPPPDTGEQRIDFTTTGNATTMRCDFWGDTTTATWHWSDGTTAPAISGENISKSGLGAGSHAHYLIISNGSALTRFGAADGGGQGNLVSITGINNFPLLQILYAYNEGSLTTLSRTEATVLREFHLMGTGLSAAAMDQIFADAVATGVTNGTMWCPNGGTAASAGNRATLAARGWNLYY